jgi:hypothetical protein
MTTLDEIHAEHMQNPDYATAYDRIKRAHAIKDKWKHNNSWQMGSKRNKAYRPAKRNRNA